MAYIFNIKVSASLQDGDLLTRILDFKEDLHRQCFGTEDITVSDPKAVDSALLPLSFSVQSKAGLARFTKLIKKSAAFHRVEQAVQVSRP
ncbi:MAG: hypothetical protein EOP84_06310 [Verrucomicrobiaceae bacterium]|nr:MAG: hypothetical protein EOP84_06310 [Verrucomicrobiaceae bacterium]